MGRVNVNTWDLGDLMEDKMCNIIYQVEAFSDIDRYDLFAGKEN